MEAELLNARARALKGGTLDSCVSGREHTLGKFSEPHRYPKWRDVNLAATVPGWTRWSVADEMLRRRQQRDPNVAEFMSFLNEQGGAALTQEQREALYGDFVKWQRRRSSVQQ